MYYCTLMRLYAARDASTLTPSPPSPTRSSLQVYERAATGVPKEQRLSVIDIYLAKASEFFGIGKVRTLA